MKLHALMGAMALVLAASPALADTSAYVAAGWSFISPILMPVIGLAGSIGVALMGRAIWAAVNRGLDAFEQKTGIEIDAKNREALHSALETGLNLALQRGAPEVQNAIAAWVKMSVPGAIAHFGITDEKLDALVDAKIGKAAASSVAAAVAAPLALPGALLSGLASGLAGAGAAVESPAMERAAGGIGGA